MELLAERTWLRTKTRKLRRRIDMLADRDASPDSQSVRQDMERKLAHLRSMQSDRPTRHNREERVAR